MSRRPSEQPPERLKIRSADTPLHDLEQEAIERLVNAVLDDDWKQAGTAFSPTWLLDLARNSQPWDLDDPTADPGGSTQTYDPPPMPDPTADPPSGMAGDIVVTPEAAEAGTAESLLQGIETQLRVNAASLRKIADDTLWIDLTATLATTGYLLRARQHLAAEISNRN